MWGGSTPLAAFFKPSLRVCYPSLSPSLQSDAPHHTVLTTYKQSKPQREQKEKLTQIIAGRGNLLLDSARPREGSEEDVMEDG